jgi:hypothetical protein
MILEMSLKETVEKSQFKAIIYYSGVTGLLKIHIIHFSVSLSGHDYLVLQGSLTLLTLFFAV